MRTLSYMKLCRRKFRTNEGSVEYETTYIFKIIDVYVTVIVAKVLQFMEPIENTV